MYYYNNKSKDIYKLWIIGGSVVYFLEDTILSPGEKIRRIRGYLGLKQSEITGGKVTRNLISYIENGKTKLVRDTAEIIVSSMMGYAEQNGIPLEITAEYLMRSERNQANQLLNQYLVELKNSLDDDKSFNIILQKAEQIFRYWDIKDKKAEIYEITGDHLYGEEQFIKSNIYYIKALENYIKETNDFKIAEVYLKVGRNKIVLKDYQEGIYYNIHAKLILDENNIKDINLHNRILYNNALAYKNLDQYVECLESLENLEATSEYLNKSQHLDILLLKGNVYFRKKEYKMAEKIYEQIIDMSEEEQLDLKASAYFNMGEIYLKKYNKIENAMEYFHKCMHIELIIENYNLVDTYLNLGRCYRAMGDYENEALFLNKSLEAGKQWKNHISLVEVYKEILQFYIRNDKEEELDNLVEEIKGLIDKKEEMRDLLIRVSYYYCDKKNGKSKALLRYLLD